RAAGRRGHHAVLSASVNSTRSSRRYCAIHSAANVPTLAASTTTVLPNVLAPIADAQLAAPTTARVDSPRPANDSAQNGPISARTDRGPRLRHTQRRFSSNDGTVPAAVAKTFAQPGDAEPVA